MKERNTFDFWYAVNNTEVVHHPRRNLETFGSTMLNYHLVSELMDSLGRIRVREGRMLATQPKIITPEAYAETVLEGFGDEAGRYIEWLKEHEKKHGKLRVLQYGYMLKRESFSEHVINDSFEAVVERVKEKVRQSNDPASAVVVGVDDPWDVCLVKLFWEIIQKSAVTNIKEMAQRNLLGGPADPEESARAALEKAFLEASRNPSLINDLAGKLQAMGLFEECQDRFFSLVKASKHKS